MGAPKQKWTEEEEEALRAGVLKHGAGKWRTILKDPEFSSILCLRSNVDLKDKWRNMSVVANGWGSRDRGKTALKRSVSNAKNEDYDYPASASTMFEDCDDDIVEAMPQAVSGESMHMDAPEESLPRLENLIVEAITSLKEPHGSDKDSIAMYIADQYWLPPNFRHILSSKLKILASSGKLIRVKGLYRITPVSGFSEYRSSRVMHIDGRHKEYVKLERENSKPVKNAQHDMDLARIRVMTAKEAATAAARAVAEAEIAMAEAEEAAREAEAAEAEAEEALAFAEAAMITLRNRNSGNLASHPHAGNMRQCTVQLC